MLTKIMMWVSIAGVLLALLELPITSEPVLVEIAVCGSGLLVICQGGSRRPVPPCDRISADYRGFQSDLAHCNFR
jgi:hypothetical protein